MKHHYAIILAGGVGMRFWPLSRNSKPKQFLPLMHQETLLQMTVKRVKSKIPAKNIIILTNKDYLRMIKSQTKSLGLPAKNILLEPEPKNTAPSIYWAALKIYQQDPKALLAVLPSDHLILKKKNFLTIVDQAFALAKENVLVTLGIKPTRPDTGYGYLKTKTVKMKIGGKIKSAVKVDRFTEKPSLPKAEQFIKNKNYFWNSGMFFWGAETTLQAFQQHLPKVVSGFAGRHSQETINRFWKKLPSISIDYGILEKAQTVMCVPAKDIGWSDLGTWDSLNDVISGNTPKNILQGDVLELDATNSFVWGNDKNIVLLGVDNLIVVDTQDALLVCQKGRSQDVKKVVEQLKALKRTNI
ncbi:MAG: mannose-1-phosphate guanylyltransferase [Candidatus Omnitrophica bacterium]|nr:mannose-1-phosphate guanylyltransferase [Candidatus Omnitrophota bacterium]